jgi:HD superfamily phosphohydrolase
MKITTVNCKQHGKLNEKNANLSKDSRIKGAMRWRCRLCAQEKSAIWRNANREKHRKLARDWQQRNTKRINAELRKDRKKNPEKYREYEKEKRAKAGDRHRENRVIQDVNRELKGLCRIHGLQKTPENNYTCCGSGEPVVPTPPRKRGCYFKSTVSSSSFKAIASTGIGSTKVC